MVDYPQCMKPHLVSFSVVYEILPTILPQNKTSDILLHHRSTHIRLLARTIQNEINVKQRTFSVKTDDGVDNRQFT